MDKHSGWWKLERVAAIVIAIGILAGALYAIVGVKFQTKEDAARCNEDIICKVQAVSIKIQAMDVDKSVIITKLEAMDKNINSRMDRIENRLK